MWQAMSAIGPGSVNTPERWEPAAIRSFFLGRARHCGQEQDDRAIAPVLNDFAIACRDQPIHLPSRS